MVSHSNRMSRRAFVGLLSASATLAVAACGVGEKAADPDRLEAGFETAASERAGGGPSAELAGGPPFQVEPTDMVSPIGIGQNDERKDIYVVTGDNKLFEFDKDGALHFWTDGGETTEDGKFSGPTDTTQDRSRQLWVVDSGNSRIQKYGLYLGIPEGYLPKPTIWGAPGMVQLRASAEGQPFTINDVGEMRSYVALDGSGEKLIESPVEGGIWTGITVVPISGEVFALLWVPDEGVAKLYEWLAGGFGRSRDETGLEFRADLEDLDTQPGRFSVDRKDQYFVVVPETNQIRRYGIDGAFHLEWGGEGAGPGEFNGATGIQAGVIGVYVADTGNNRIQKFDAEGAFSLEWGGRGV